MTAVVKLPTAGGEQDVRIFSLRGAHLLGMFARTERAVEFRRWVLDILDREIAPVLPPPAFDWRAEIQTAGSQPRTPISANLQTAINRRAWALAHDAYELLREHLAWQIQSRAVYGSDHLVEPQAYQCLADITLDQALAPAHYQRINGLATLARMMARSATQAADELDALLAGSNFAPEQSGKLTK